MIFRSKTGFTLVELSVVGAILGLICLLCWPSVRGLSKDLIKKTEEKTSAAKIQAARERAVLTGQPQNVADITYFPDGSSN